MYHVHKLNIYVNEVWFLYVLIDNHVFEKHGEHMTTELVLQLVRELHWKTYSPSDQDQKGFTYYETDHILVEKKFRLIWCIPSDAKFIGVRTAYRKN